MPERGISLRLFFTRRNSAGRFRGASFAPGGVCGRDLRHSGDRADTDAKPLGLIDRALKKSKSLFVEHAKMLVKSRRPV
jgi:hypothetical protein